MTAPTAPCQLTELIPGYCHTIANDCIQEWCSGGGTARLVNGVPSQKIECKDDDPSCDYGASTGDRTCTFHVALCFNVSETRVPCVATGAVDEVRLYHPSPLQYRNPIEVENRLEIEAALASLGALQRGVCKNSGPQQGLYCQRHADCDSVPGNGNGRCVGRLAEFPIPLTTVNSCTSFADIKVPLVQTSHGLRSKRYRLRIQVRAPRDPVTHIRPHRDGDLLDLVCNP